MAVAAPVCRSASRDHLGSVREVVDAGTGGLEARFAYDPWGRRTQVAGTMDVDFGFTGHHYHEKSGFHLAPFREYSAKLGRWMSRDPIGENGGYNLYAYVLGNPVNLKDPTGFCPEDDCIDAGCQAARGHPDGAISGFCHGYEFCEQEKARDSGKRKRSIIEWIKGLFPAVDLTSDINECINEFRENNISDRDLIRACQQREAAKRNAKKK